MVAFETEGSAVDTHVFTKDEPLRRTYTSRL